MKTLSKIADVLLVVTIALSLVITTLIGASASVVGDNIPLLPSHNLKNITIDTAYLPPANQLDAPYYYHNGNFSLGQPIVALNSSTGEGKISGNWSQPSTGGKPVETTTRVELGQNNRLFAYFYGSATTRPQAENSAYLCGELLVEFKDYIIDPSLVQSEATVYIDWDTAHNVALSTVFVAGSTVTDIDYRGVLRYPTLNGSYIDLPYSRLLTVDLDLKNFAGELDEAQRIDEIRFALVPSYNKTPTSYNKLTSLQIYQAVYDNADTWIKDTLVPPSSLDGRPVLFTSFSVSAKSFIYSTRDGIISNQYLIPIDHFRLGLPYTQGGVARDGETLSDIFGDGFDNIVVDFENFNFIHWIENLVVGIGRIEILPNFYLLYPVVGCVALAVIVWILKVFLGG